MRFGNMLGFIRDRVVERELRMRDGQHYRRQKFMLEHPESQSVNASPTDDGDEDGDVRGVQIGGIPRLVYLIVGASIAFTFFNLGLTATFKLVAITLLIMIALKIVGTWAHRKNLKMKKFAKGEKAVEPDYSDPDDIFDLDLE